MMDEDLAGWQAPPRPARISLPGSTVSLDPLDPVRHVGGLWQELATDPGLWDFMAYGPFPDANALSAFLTECAGAADPLYFAIIDRRRGVALGWLSLMEIRPEHGVIEIGNILLGPSLQRSKGATEAFFLAATHAFDLGYRRLEWKCNAGNTRSRSAALRYGFSYEGVFRQHMVIKGRNRDTAWFSLLDKEWPMRRAALAAWLDAGNFDAAGKQIVALREIDVRTTPDS